MALAFLAWATTALAVGSTAVQIQQTRKAERANRRQMELERRRAEIANMRERRQALAMARRQQAMVRAQAAIAGATGGSAESGAIGSIRSQVGERIGFSGQQERIGLGIFDSSAAAARAGSRAQIAGAVGGLPGQLGLPNVFSPGQVFGPSVGN